jgi:hypothetical protein
MALSCNSFATNTVGSTQQTAACIGPKIANLEDHQILDEQFLLLVLDSLVRLYGPIPEGADCDLAAALRNASCAMQTNTPAFQNTITQLQSQIAYLLNEAVCAI